MNEDEAYAPKLEEMYTHLKEASFKSIITWKKRQCTVSDFELFETIVLSTFCIPFTIKGFLEFLMQFMVKYHMNEQFLSIIFPKTSQVKISRKVSGKSYIKNLDMIEEKQQKIYGMIVRIQSKLEKAIKINKQIKKELAKSEENWVHIIETNSWRLDLLSSY